MRIAITGAQGMLGRQLCRQWSAEAVGLDLPRWDLTDAAAVEGYLLDLRPDAVVNTAAFTAVDLAESQVEACRRVNVDAVAMLTGVCRRLDCPLVQISTDYVFGADAARSTPYRESDLPGAVNAYGRSKLDAERHAAAWRKHLIVRTCGLYGRPGPRTATVHFVDRMLQLGTGRRSVAVVDDQRSTPSYVPHVAAAIDRLLRTESYGIWHVVNRGDTTWHGFACEIFRQEGMDVAVQRISSRQYAAPAARPAYSVLDTSKYAAVAGAPLPPWQTALGEYLASRRA
jgi:dTDP-4-dehydrorhamnose reductase